MGAHNRLCRVDASSTKNKIEYSMYSNSKTSLSSMLPTYTSELQAVPYFEAQMC